MTFTTPYSAGCFKIQQTPSVAEDGSKDGILILCGPTGLDVLVYLSYMMTISETMIKSPKKRVDHLKQFKTLKRINIDLHYITQKF